jgi:hypothetical protein
MMALDTLCSAIPPEMVSMITKKETTKEVWDAIVTMRVDNDRVKEMMMQQLCQKFDLATFEDCETIEDYTLRLSVMAVHLTTLGEEVKDSEIVTKALRSLPPCFKHITIAIKILLDMSAMSIAYLTRRLTEVEEAF